MRLTTRRILAALAVAVATGAGVRAQGPRPPEFDTRPAVGWTFTPSVRFNTMWDSNVALAGNQSEGGTASDRLFTFEPQAQVDYRSPRADFFAGYTGDVRRYADSTALNSLDHRAFLSLRRHASRRVVWFVRNEFQDTPTTDEVELNGIPYARTGSRNNRFNAGVESRLSRYNDLAVQYENTWVAFDNTTTTLRGGVMNGVRTSYSRRLGERTKLGAQYRVRHSEIKGGRTLWFQDVGTLLAHDFSPALSLQFGTGYSTMKDSKADARRGGLFVYAELLHQADRHDIGLLYERSYAPAFGLGGSSHNQDLRAYVRMPFSRNRAYIQASGGWRRSNSLLTAALSFDQFDSDVTAGYGFARWLRGEVFHTYSRQDSRMTGGEINRHRAGVQFVVSQPMRIQ
jgi:hypothetical protein